MNPYVIPVTCAICGGPGNASAQCGLPRFDDEFTHKDYRVCQSYLEKTKQFEKQKQQQSLLQSQGAGI